LSNLPYVDECQRPKRLDLPSEGEKLMFSEIDTEEVKAGSIPT